MPDISAFKALSRETKSLIFINEFQSRRMPMFQLREIMDLLIKDDDEKRIVIDLIEHELRSKGYPIEPIDAFLKDLVVSSRISAAVLDELQHTKRVRSPFMQGFESDADAAGTPPQPAKAPGEATGPAPRQLPIRGPMSALASGSGEHARTAMPFETIKSSTIVPPGVTAHIPSPRNARGSGSAAAIKSVSGETASPAAPRAASGSGPAAAVLNVPATGSAAGLPPVSPPRETVLLAEDDKRTRMVFKLRLEEAGFAVAECPTGADAWERVQQGGVVAAVLDMKMPGMHGLEVLRHMAEKKMTIPVVVCSAYDQLEDEFVIHAYPAIKFLVKPIAPEQIVIAIRTMLARSH